MRFLFLLLALSLFGCANARTPVAPEAPSGDPRSIAVRETKHGFVFVRGDGTELTEDELRAAYRTDTGKTDLDDELAAATLHRHGLIAVGLGTGLAAGSVTWLALMDCKTAAVRSSCERGEASLALLAAIGVYTVGCEAIKGPKCFTDGNVNMNNFAPAHLDRERASYYADRYNDAIAGRRPDDEPEATATPRPNLTLGPSGVSGRF